MEFVKQYLKIVSYVCSGLVFAFAAFYFLANLYHYYELRKNYITDFNSQSLVIEMDSALAQIQENINTFNPNTYNGSISTSDMRLLNQNLSNCINSFNNEVINSMREKNVITIIDVYNLRESYENNILSECIVNNLNKITIEEEDYGSTYLANNKELIKMYVYSLRNATSYLKKDLLNNSSYFYNTAIASSSIKDSTRDGFFEVMDAYNRAANFVLYVSNWYRMEAEGSL